MSLLIIPISALTTSLNTSTTKSANVFRNFPVSFTADRIYITGHSLTGTSPTYRICLQSLTSGYPSGTVLGGTTAKKDMQLAAGVNTCMLDTPYAITAGDEFAVVVQYLSGTINGSNTVTVLSNVTGVKNQNIYQMGIAGSFAATTGRTYGLGLHCPASSSYTGGVVINSAIATSLTSKKKIAIEWVCPARFQDYYLYGLQKLGPTSAVVAYSNYETDKVAGAVWDDAYNRLTTTDNFDYGSVSYWPISFRSPIRLQSGKKYLIGCEVTAGSINLTNTAYTVVDDTNIETFQGSDNYSALVPGMVVHSHNGTSWTKHTGFSLFFATPMSSILLRPPGPLLTLRSHFQN